MSIWKSLKKGFTLIEIMIASFIAMILMGVIISIFFFGRKAYDYARYSYIIDLDTYTAIKWIKKDLIHTNLGTIWTISDEDLRKVNFEREVPVLTFESAVDPKTGNFTINKYGSAYWKKYVIYTIVKENKPLPEAEGIKVGRLMRYEKILTPQGDPNDPYPPMPKMLDLSNSLQLPDGVTNARVVLQNVVLPGQNLDRKGGVEKYQGFLVRFVRKVTDSSGDVHWVLTSQNPSQTPGSDIDQNTLLVHVELTTLLVSTSTGKPNVFNFAFVVYPRN